MKSTNTQPGRSQKRAQNISQYVSQINYGERKGQWFLKNILVREKNKTNVAWGKRMDSTLFVRCQSASDEEKLKRFTMSDVFTEHRRASSRAVWRCTEETWLFQVMEYIAESLLSTSSTRLIYWSALCRCIVYPILSAILINVTMADVVIRQDMRLIWVLYRNSSAVVNVIHFRRSQC